MKTNKLFRNLIVLGMIGIVQTGFCATFAEASPHFPSQVNYNSHNNNNHKISQSEHDRRLKEENRRHEAAMKRKAHESKQDWEKRKKIENDRHNSNLSNLESLLIGVVIGKVIS